MKLVTVKEYVLLVATLPVLMVRLAFAYAKLFCYWLRHKLTERLYSIGKPVPAKEETSAAKPDDRPTVTLEELLTWCSGKDEAWIEHFRKRLEITGVGPRVVAEHPDRHLYALLRPTREENMARIGNVLRGMQPRILSDLLAEITPKLSC